MEFRSMVLRMQIYVELQNVLFLFYALERTIFIRKYEATNYFRLMTPAVDQSDSIKLMTQRPVASLIDAAWSDWLPYSLQYSCLLIRLWETFLAMENAFFSKIVHHPLSGDQECPSPSPSDAQNLTLPPKLKWLKVAALPAKRRKTKCKKHAGQKRRAVKANTKEEDESSQCLMRQLTGHYTTSSQGWHSSMV